MNLDAIVDGFKIRWGVPQCVGVDGSHVPICVPTENHTDCKGGYSVVLQGLVDHRYCFLDVYIGWPVSAHDARVFAHSSLHSIFELLPHVAKHNGVDVPLFILCDSSYPLEPWLGKKCCYYTAV